MALFPDLLLFPAGTLFPSGIGAGGPVSDGRSTVYTIGDEFAAVKNGQPFVDVDHCWIRISREEGWAPGAPARVNTTKWPTRDGQRSSQLLQDARTIVLGGQIVAGDTLSLHRAMDRITALLAGDVREDILTVAEPHLRRHLTVRRDGQPEVSRWSPFFATFQLTLVADDPRRLGDTLTATAKLPASTGGWTFPMTFPFAINSTVVSGSASLTNVGDVAGPVVVRIDGPCTGPVITHLGSGQTLVLGSDYELPAGNWLTVDMENQLVLENDQVSRNGFITSRGWSQFDVGDNEWAVSAAVYNPATLFTFTAQSAWP